VANLSIVVGERGGAPPHPMPLAGSATSGRNLQTGVTLQCTRVGIRQESISTPAGTTSISFRRLGHSPTINYTESMTRQYSTQINYQQLIHS